MKKIMFSFAIFISVFAVSATDIDYAIYRPANPIADRSIWLDSRICPEILQSTIMRINELNDGSGLPIHIYINSYGGEVTSGLAIMDALERCNCPKYTYVLGNASSMAAIIFLAGEKRYMSKNASLMFHSISMAFQGRIQDSRAELLDSERMTETISNIIKTVTGCDDEFVTYLLINNRYMYTEEALESNIATDIME